MGKAYCCMYVHVHADVGVHVSRVHNVGRLLPSVRMRLPMRACNGLGWHVRLAAHLVSAPRSQRMKPRLDRV